MAKVVVTAIGSRGDVAPMIAIGSRLQEAGHEVVLTALTVSYDLIADSGLRYLPHEVGTGENADLSEVRDPVKQVMQFLSPKGMQTTGEALLKALADEPADILLLSPFAELAGHPLAEARGIPSIGVRLQPMSITAAYPPSLLGAWSASPALNRTAGRLAATTVDRVYGKPVAAFRRQLGLPKVSTKALRRRRTEAEWPILHGYSPLVAPRPADWRPGLDVVGYWWPPQPLGWEPPEHLVRFLAAGPPPVYVGFGSLPMVQAERERVSGVIAEALRKAKVRGLVQAGWASLSVTADDVITIGEVPHDWLFDHVGAVVHSCGAGTAGAGLRAGVPAVGIPNAGGDQRFWARRLHELGVSAGTLSRSKMTADSLAAAITTALTDPGLRANAKAVAAKLADEDGAAAVVTAVERLT
ncbi:glycosyltransferase [Kutzneria sp. CA-103260]|uniref:glycosyltransferase n=1 Tax=Kutzneria sp. CA-103260 TaxID=2802641 RepID=UPI001BAC5FC1|nr:glycosyltransferase [Kutzneria sp. CA-103260]QUQ66022.1 glycosyltransferase [Kutzneria sp. CA-103260]